jgi:hypothetical protein
MEVGAAVEVRRGKLWMPGTVAGRPEGGRVLVHLDEGTLEAEDVDDVRRREPDTRSAQLDAVGPAAAAAAASPAASAAAADAPLSPAASAAAPSAAACTDARAPKQTQATAGTGTQLSVVIPAADSDAEAVEDDVEDPPESGPTVQLD